MGLPGHAWIAKREVVAKSYVSKAQGVGLGWGTEHVCVCVFPWGYGGWFGKVGGPFHWQKKGTEFMQ